jgi:O-succinylbenzoic acid--CoA ligase
MFKDIVLLDGISDEYLHSIENFLAEWESYSPIISVSTSGSTGAPKTIEFNKKQAEASAKYTGRFFDFKSGDCVLLNLSPNFVAGKLMLVRALTHQMKIVVAPLNSNPLLGLKKFPHKIKLAAFVPHQVEEILSNENSKRLFNEIENVIIGGASISDSLEKKIAEQKTKSFATFGMTETLTHFALRPVDGKTDFYNCLPGITISADDRNCLIVNQNEILSDRLVTNDIIELIDERHFRWKGRFDNVINSGGVKIIPEADEKLIESLFGTARFYLSSKSNSKFGEEVVLVLESDPLGSTLEKKFLEKMEILLPKYHAPKSIIVQSKFAETANGKIRRGKF